jgi:hypothetical protein
MGIKMHQYLDTDKNMKELLSLFNKTYHDELNQRLITMPNTLSSHDVFWIHTDYVRVEGTNEVKCQLVFDTDASYIEGDNFISIKLTNPNVEARIVLGDIFDRDGTSRLTSTIWEKSSVMIKASFADVDSDNFLGHTRKMIYTPIKYYKIISTDQKFWLEFYSSSDYRCPVDFPSRKITKEVKNDNGDTHTVEYEEPILNLLMETILLFNSNSII